MEDAISSGLADHGISINAMVQSPEAGEDVADIIFLTHEAVERDVNHAIEKMEALDSVRSSVVRLRMEHLA